MNLRNKVNRFLDKSVTPWEFFIFHLVMFLIIGLFIFWMRSVS
ncbi:hypothetical protein SAMN04489868_11254 [Pisciglobus halotolerans]|uniref:Uncharacterized protein n=1 Tax=Pisciglobus halotolerans TaxID=745365 RepID=A0A1I3C399_9LACT|nr:hypothetical protein SAMN04489868_11254 [Pisciglobus halotolerans]